MKKKKVLIIGGGIGGLSCATALAETGKFDISIYDSDILGGQASSKKSKLCNTEIAWRVFGLHYRNIFSIINKLKIEKNFYEIKHNDVCENNNQPAVGGSKNLFRVVLNVIKNNNFNQIGKIMEILFICKKRAINDYHNITVNKFFNNNNYVNVLVGPYFGLEPKKATLSSYYKFLYSCFQDWNVLWRSPARNSSEISKYPTQDSLFKPWEKYLKKRGVKIFEKTGMNDIITNSNGKITNIIINNIKYEADEIVFACSLKPLIKIFNNNYYLKNTLVNKKLNILNAGQQFYISVNFYWKKRIISDRKCHMYTFYDGWMPIILKRFINTDYVKNNCDKNIKEVWNIGLADYLKGNYIKKYTSKSSFKEMIYEIKMNLINSPHFNKYGINKDTWDDLFYTYEFDDRYYRKLPTTEKFSINKNIEKNLLNNKEGELGNNIYFSAYYVKGTVGGASMETSCEIGLKTADLICKKNKVHNSMKPEFKTRSYIYILLLPFVILDYILYKMKLEPITNYISPIILLILYFIMIIVGLIYLNNIYLKKSKKY